MPGVTRASEAQQILDDLPFVGKVTADDNQYSWRSTARFVARIEHHGGYVTKITLPPESTAFSAGDVVDRYGEPGAVELSFRGVEVAYLDVGLWYPDRGVVFLAHAIYNMDGGCLHPTALVYAQFYGAPGALDDFITGLHLTPDEEYRIRKSFVPWSGFGCSGYD